MEEQNMIFEGDPNALSGDRMNAPADFNSLLLYQITRINVIASKEGSTWEPGISISYRDAVNQLGILLTPYEDNQFEQDMVTRERLKEELTKGEEQINKNIRMSVIQYQIHKRMKLTDSLFKALMQLCARKNFFPGRRVSLNASQ